jgi:hypothetical protein
MVAQLRDRISAPGSGAARSHAPRGAGGRGVLVGPYARAVGVRRRGTSDRGLRDTHVGVATAPRSSLPRCRRRIGRGAGRCLRTMGCRTKSRSSRPVLSRARTRLPLPATTVSSRTRPCVLILLHMCRGWCRSCGPGAGSSSQILFRSARTAWKGRWEISGSKQPRPRKDGRHLIWKDVPT